MEMAFIVCEKIKLAKSGSSRETTPFAELTGRSHERYEMVGDERGADAGWTMTDEGPESSRLTKSALLTIF